jgi:hypothetical protein
MLTNKILVSAGKVKASDVDVLLKGGGALDIASVRGMCACTTATWASTNGCVSTASHTLSLTLLDVAPATNETRRCARSPRSGCPTACGSTSSR